MAAAAGVRLVRILSLSTGDIGPRPEFDIRLAAAPMKSVPIAQGERTITVTSSLSFEIAPQ